MNTQLQTSSCKLLHGQTACTITIIQAEILFQLLISAIFCELALNFCEKFLKGGHFKFDSLVLFLLSSFFLSLSVGLGCLMPSLLSLALFSAQLLLLGTIANSWLRCSSLRLCLGSILSDSLLDFSSDALNITLDLILLLLLGFLLFTLLLICQILIVHACFTEVRSRENALVVPVFT